MRNAILAMALLTGAQQAAAQLPQPLPLVADHPVVEDHYPERRVVFANGAIGLPDLVYAQPLGFRPLTLDVYLPPESMRVPPHGFPMVLHIHGGAWVAGHSRHAGALSDFPGVLASLATKGYVVASLNYRLSGEAPFPAAAQDVKTAIRWLRKRASDYRMDPIRAVVWGGSAGGQLAAISATSCGVVADISDCVQGAVAWYGVFDFMTLDAQARKTRSAAMAPAGFLDCKASDCAKAKQAASPVTYVDARDPPMLLIAGTADRTVPYLQTLEMTERLKAAHVPVETIIIPDVGHSFIGSTPAATRDATLKALGATFDFIDRTLKQ